MIEPGRLHYRDGRRGVALLRDDIFYLLDPSDHPSATCDGCVLMVSYAEGDQFARMAEDNELTIVQKLEYSILRRATCDSDGSNALDMLVEESYEEIKRLREALYKLASAAARIIEGDGSSSIAQYGELNRCRSNASAILSQP